MAILVTVAVRYGPQCGQKFPPLEPSPWWLGDEQTKLYISSTLAKVMGFKVKSIKKNDAKVPNFGADLVVGSCFGQLCRQLGRKTFLFLSLEL